MNKIELIDFKVERLEEPFTEELEKMIKYNKYIQNEINVITDELFTKINDLQERINKAIEHLNIKQIRFLNEKNYILNDEDLDEIMQILTGDSNE